MHVCLEKGGNAWIPHAMFTDEQGWALKAHFNSTVRLVKHHHWKIKASKSVTGSLSRKACVSIKNGKKKACFPICLPVYAAHGLPLRFSIHNNVKHAHLIYYLVIFHHNKKHFWFSLVWSWHCISIISSLNINHGLHGMHSFLFICLKIQMACCSGQAGCNVWTELTEEAENGMFCLKFAEKSLFCCSPSLSLSLPLQCSPMTAVWGCEVLSGDFQPSQADNNFNNFYKKKNHTHTYTVCILSHPFVFCKNSFSNALPEKKQTDMYIILPINILLCKHLCSFIIEVQYKQIKYM